MSIGIFRSIRGSYVESARRAPERLIRALNEELRRRGWPEYRDPDPDERTVRRLPCGNAGSSTFGALADRASGAGSTFTLWGLRGERPIAIPYEFEGRMAVPMGRLFFLVPQTQEFCAVRLVAKELVALAQLLGIPLTKGTVTEEIAAKIADCEQLPDDADDQGEEDGSLENERSLWLDLHLACRYSLEDGTPVVLAG